MNSYQTVAYQRHPARHSDLESLEYGVAARGDFGHGARDPFADTPSGTRSTPRSCLRVEAGGLLPPELRGAVVALGNFDGFHLGHQAVIGQAVAMARARGVAAIVATFDPHPVRHFSPERAPFLLTNLDQRQRMAHAAGVDAVMVFAFGSLLAEVRPEDFVHRWLDGLGGVVTGTSFCFGRKRSGTVTALAALTAERGMVFDAVGAVAADGEIVSSSRIRRALAIGDCETAAALLTRPYTIAGQLRGDGPAGSIQLGCYLRPPAGPYAVRVRRPDGSSVVCTGRFAAGSDTLRLEDCPGSLEPHNQPVEVEILNRLSPLSQTAACVAATVT